MKNSIAASGGEDPKSGSLGPPSRPKGVIPDELKDLMSKLVRQEAENWNVEETERFVEKYEEESKSTFFAYLFWLLFGWHYAYLGRWKKTLLFLITAGGAGIWWLVDAFRVPGLVKEHNRDAVFKAAEEIGPIEVDL
ncbi:TM2 domain-containing protein [Candidatus Bipolaricaulota bacterium]|nr:TM2 domain-containing protein [Candidatus Bipolaricaulota bacterium]